MAAVPTILSIDAGGTGIRAVLMDRTGALIRQSYLPTPISHPAPGATEHDPEEVWSVCRKVISLLFEGEGAAYLPLVEAVGLTNQRSTFCFWDPVTGKPATPFINWQDVRAASTAEAMNRNPLWRGMRKIAAIMAAVTGSTIMKATSMLVFNTDHSLTKVKWLLDRTPGLKERCRSREVVFGTVDSWLIYKLTGGRAHLTDLTNASSTSMYNPFDLKWNPIFCRLFDIPMAMFPEVKESSDDYGSLDPEILGRSIPITSAIGDQQAALFGHRCFRLGEVKVSMGSGGFVNINVGPKGKVSRRGLFPLIGWSYRGNLAYMLEGQVATMGTFIDWMVNKLGFFSSPAEINELAASREDAEDLLVIPTPSGLRFPYFQPQRRASFGMLEFRHDRTHFARGIIEGLAHRVLDILEGIREDTGTEFKVMKVDGGVSRSDPLLQCLADLSGVTVERAPDHEITIRGAAYLAGLKVGFWKSDEEITSLALGYQAFSPSRSAEWAAERRQFWKDSLKRGL